MEPLIKVMSDIQGKYDWDAGRDCLSLAGEISILKNPDYEEQIQDRVDFYHTMSESRAIATIINEHEGVFKGIVAVLQEILEETTFTIVQSADVSMNQILTPANFVELPEKYGGHGRFGVIGNDCFIWTWQSWRLGPLNNLNP